MNICIDTSYLNMKSEVLVIKFHNNSTAFELISLATKHFFVLFIMLESNVLDRCRAR